MEDTTKGTSDIEWLRLAATAFGQVWVVRQEEDVEINAVSHYPEGRKMTEDDEDITTDLFGHRRGMPRPATP